MSLTSSFADIKDSVGGLSNIGEGFSSIWDGGSPDTISSKTSHALQDVKPMNWNTNPGYAFKITGLNSFTAGFTNRYRLQLNPQSITQTEPFSINIVPTQAGVFTENQGFVLKDLTISGTTGIRPRPGISGVTEGGLTPTAGGKTGYQEFLDFRNFIRKYAELKTLAECKNVKLVFQNFKDNEFWYVEPISFTGSRSKDKPFCYDYSVQFKIIGKEVLEIGTDWFSQALNTIDKISATINEAIEIFNGSIAFLQQVEQFVENIVLLPLQTASLVIESINTGKNVVCSLPRKFMENLHFEIKRLRDNVFDFIGEGDTRYDDIYDRKPSLVSDTTGLSTEVVGVLKALAAADNAIAQFICTNKYFSQDIAKININNEIINQDSIISTDEILDKQVSSKKNILKAFNNEIDLPTPNSVGKININYNDTLEKISVRYLGDATRWHEIVALNKLKPPYISDIAGDGIKAYGDEILIPSGEGIIFNEDNVVDTRLTSITKNLTEQERKLGVDLKIDSDGNLIFNAKKDIDLCYGFENIKQAIMLKLAYERGSLMYHPEVGVGLFIGDNNDIMIDELTQSIRETILADKRFASISGLKLKKVDNAVYLDLKVVLANTKKEVPLLLTF